jgi:hypothetical protein
MSNGCGTKIFIMSYVLEKNASCKQLKKSTGSSNTTIEIKTTKLANGRGTPLSYRIRK